MWRRRLELTRSPFTFRARRGQRARNVNAKGLTKIHTLNVWEGPAARRNPALRRLQPLRLWRVARRPRQADRLPLRQSRRPADQFREEMGIPAVVPDAPRRPALRP